MLACHAGGPGSIPGRCNLLPFFSQSLVENFIKSCGGAGYRSRYLSHAKRALYHLSYAPNYKKTWSVCCLAQTLYVDLTQNLETLDNRSELDCGAESPNLNCAFHSTFDSSVGRAVDCSWLKQRSIGRWFKSGSKDCLFFSKLAVLYRILKEVTVTTPPNNPR
jgi:hypothetical protein